MKTVTRTIRLNASLLAWFEEAYPHANLDTAIDLLFSKFKEVHHVTPEDMAIIGAIELRKLLHNSDEFDRGLEGEDEE